MKNFRMYLMALLIIAIAASPLFGSERRMLGVRAEPLTMEEAREHALSTGWGLRVKDILAGSPADKAGVKKGDILLSLNGVVLKDLDALDRAVLASPIKGEVLIWRNGWERPFEVEFPPIKKPEVKKEKETEDVAEVSDDLLERMRERVEAQKREYEELKKLYEEMKEREKKDKDEAKKDDKKEHQDQSEKKPEKSPERQPTGRPFVGISVGVHSETGQIGIVSVETGSPAEEYGLKAGDIITEINGKKIESAQDLQQVLVRCNPGDWLKLSIIRAGNKMEIKLKLGSR